MPKKRQQPKTRTSHFPAWPEVSAINLYGGLSCRIIVTVDKSAAGITVCHPPKTVRCEQMAATLAIRGPKGHRGNLAVTQVRPDGTLFVLSPVGEDEPNETMEITIPNLARSRAELHASGMIAIGVHNASKTSRTRDSQPGDVFFLGDPGAYEALHKPTFEA